MTLSCYIIHVAVHQLIHIIHNTGSTGICSILYIQPNNIMLISHICRNIRIKESGASKMVTNTFMPNSTMLKYIKRRWLWYIYCLGSLGIYGFCDRLKAPPVFYNTSKNRTSVELMDVLYNEMPHLLILQLYWQCSQLYWQYYGFNWWNKYLYWWINTY